MRYSNHLQKKGNTHMKKWILSSLSLALLLLLTACGNGISSEDYEAVVAENTSLKSEIESLTAENESLSESNKELLDEKTEQVMDQLPDAYSTAWVKAAFGDNSICFSGDDNKHLQCIAGNTYSISSEGISDLWSDLLLSLTTLAYVKDSISHEIISIKFLDPSGTYILEVTLNLNEDSDMLQAIMCNVVHADVIIPALQNVTN